MSLNRQIFKTELDGEPVELEVSELAKQANASVIGRWGDTTVLATAVMAKSDKAADYFPLTVEYEEKFYAAGKIIGSRFIRREGRPSQEAVLSARLIDRTIRPLFDQRMRREVQIVITVLSYDETHDPDFIALLAASTALCISNIPWNGPVAGVQIKQENPEIEAFFSGTKEKINMIEFGGEEIPESGLFAIFSESRKKIRKLVEFQETVVKKIGSSKAQIEISEPGEILKKKVLDFLSRQEALEVPASELTDYLRTTGENSEALSAAQRILEEEIDKILHRRILENEKRPDGRKLDEIRSLYAEVGLIKRLHGSALFIRGETQALSVTTLAAPGAEQLVETMEESGKKRFMHHYNFPPYSTGEIGFFRGPGRREIGHGALAEKALKYILPSMEEFPYIIRVVSEVLSSNGSSSMASACAGCLSMMDAGVPLKEPVAGIAMGLIISKDRNQFKILTDIQGPEDHHGDMDLKVAGTRNGVTAIQMDVKVDGITADIFKEALEQARKARLQILETIFKTLPAPRKEISSYAPVVLRFKIKPEKIGEVIGPGGKIINGIIQATGGLTAIEIEEDGSVFVSGPSRKEAEQALEQIKGIVKEYEAGELVEGSIIRILDFGAIVDLGGGKDGMIHVSELKNGFVKKVEDVVKVGDRVKAKVVRVDPDGKIALSLKRV